MGYYSIVVWIGPFAYLCSRRFVVGNLILLISNELSTRIPCALNGSFNPYLTTNKELHIRSMEFQRCQRIQIPINLPKPNHIYENCLVQKYRSHCLVHSSQLSKCVSGITALIFQESSHVQLIVSWS